MHDAELSWPLCLCAIVAYVRLSVRPLQANAVHRMLWPLAGKLLRNLEKATIMPILRNVFATGKCTLPECNCHNKKLSMLALISSTHHHYFTTVIT